MTAQASAKELRVQNINKDISATQIEALLKQFCSDRERLDLDIKVSLVPSCSIRDGSLSALVKINPTLPEFLQHLGKSDHQIKSDSTILNIDKNFFGLTQLYPTTDGRAIAAEYVPGSLKPDLVANADALCESRGCDWLKWTAFRLMAWERSVRIDVVEGFPML